MYGHRPLVVCASALTFYVVTKNTSLKGDASLCVCGVCAYTFACENEDLYGHLYMDICMDICVCVNVWAQAPAIEQRKRTVLSPVGFSILMNAKS